MRKVRDPDVSLETCQPRNRSKKVLYRAPHRIAKTTYSAQTRRLGAQKYYLVYVLPMDTNPNANPNLKSLWQGIYPATNP